MIGMDGEWVKRTEGEKYKSVHEICSIQELCSIHEILPEKVHKYRCVHVTPIGWSYSHVGT